MGLLHLDFVLYDDLQEIPDGSRDSATRGLPGRFSEKDSADRQIDPNADLDSYKMEKLHQHVQQYTIFRQQLYAGEYAAAGQPRLPSAAYAASSVTPY